MAATPTANGTPAAPQALRESLKARFREALAAGKPKTARRLLETFWLWDSFGGSDLWDRARPRQNDDGDATRWVPPSSPSDRRHGSQWPVWRTHPELDQLRQQARLRVASNAYAQGLLDNLTNNVIGKGFAYEVEPRLKKGEDATPAHEAACAAVQAVVDEFLNLNEWNGDADNDSDEALGPSREREIYRRVKEDGEAFVRLHRRDDGTTLTRFIEPELVRDQGGVVPQDGWGYGIRHQMDPFEDVQTPLEYSVFWPDPSAPGGEGGPDSGTFQVIDAAEVVHVKGLSTPSTVKRGLSVFLFDVGAALDRAAKGQRNASLGAGHRAATAEIWQHQTATLASITNLQQTLGELSGTDAGTGQPRYVERLEAPAVRRIPAGQELVPLPADSSESYLAAFQGDLRQAAAAACAPEFWMAETSSGNYSNLESAAAPAVRAGTAEQEYFKKVFRRVLWKAIGWAAECGRLPGGVRELVRLHVEAPAVLHRNELEKAQEDQIGVSVGWKDRQSCAEERGLEWEQVQERNQEFNDQQLQQQVDAQTALGLPGENEGPPKPGGGGKPPVPFGEGRLFEDFDPSEPRDKSGEWTSGGGGGSSNQAGTAAPKADNGGGPEVVPPKVHRAAVARARAKLRAAPPPSAEEVAAAKEGMARKGANKFRKDLIGNTGDRRKRRERLLAEFGDGTTCPCIYCGTKVGHGTLEQDKIFTTAQGGRYRTPNLVPACGDCNKRRGDMPFAQALKKVVRYAGAAP